MWCNEQLGKLQKVLNEESPADVALLAVSTDSPEDSQKMIRQVKEAYALNLSFPLLADGDHKVIGRYGLLNMGTAPGPSTRRFATPATFILDKQGVVRWRMVEENWKIRPTNELILTVLKKIRSGEDASDVDLRSVSVMEDPPRKETAPAAEREALGEMILIDAGSFRMGVSGGRDSAQHEVELDAYYIDKYEVTNQRYHQFLEDIKESNDHSRCHPLESRNKDHTPLYWNDPRYGEDDFPVVGVDWFDADAYCAWAGKTLQTEAQWEHASRAGVEGRGYPWGDEMDESKANLNPTAGENAAVLADLGRMKPGADLKSRGPKSVGSYEPNDFGLHDLIGNAEEWCQDWYGEDYYPRSPSKNPQGPEAGILKVVRGGSWHHAQGRPTTRYTHPPDQRGAFLGFRCVQPGG